MNPETANQLLRDIHGLDPVSWWPPGPGWWLLLLVLLLTPAMLSALRNAFLRHRQRPWGSWHRDAAAQLHQLRGRVGQTDSKELAGELSELLRRIAVARCGRTSCARLAGEPWLVWLKKQDPLGFDWVKRGRALLDLPYAPPGVNQHNIELQGLIDAALAWTKTSADCPLDQSTEAEAEHA